MKKLAAGTAAILALPLAVVAVLYVCGTDILSDPDFWSGYMAFFGTVVLGAIAIAQNGRANDINGELMKLQNEAQMLQIKEKASPVDFEPVRIDKETDGYVVRDNIEEFSVTNQKYKYAFFIESPHVKRENRELFNFVMELENISGMILKEISISSFKLYDIITNKSNVTAEKEKIREYPYNGDCVIKCILKPGKRSEYALK